MEQFKTFEGLVAAMDRSNVDTDQIIPKQFLKRIERTGFGEFVFFDWRYNDQKLLREEFELNRPENLGASILLVRRDFGTGSSREHAVWALADYGFRCVIAESFGDIFYNNCFKNGLLPIRLDESKINRLFSMKGENTNLHLTIDLEEKMVTAVDGFKESFEIEEFRRQNLIQGLDDIGLTLQHVDQIERFELEQGMQPITS